jgi:hypothetical protein
MLSPLPLSPIYREFSDQLRAPEPEDSRWLLLPAVLLDDRAVRVRELVSAAPDIYPGFYTLPTPAKEEKRAQLEHVMRSLNQTIGRTFFDRRVARLLKQEDRAVEQELLAAPRDPVDRIGTGLALGVFQRTRERQAFLSGEEPFRGTRGARLVRERLEPARSAS